MGIFMSVLRKHVYLSYKHFYNHTHIMTLKIRVFRGFSRLEIHNKKKKKKRESKKP